VWEVVVEVGISKSSCHEILVDNLGMQQVAAKFLPCLLTDEQKQKCLKLSQELFDCANNDKNFVKNIITGDETWVYGCDVKSKAQSSQWVSEMSPRSKRHTASLVKYEGDVNFFFNCEVSFTMNFYLIARLSRKNNILK
jgi:hypothetical protein